MIYIKVKIDDGIKHPCEYFCLRYYRQVKLVNSFPKLISAFRRQKFKMILKNKSQLFNRTLNQILICFCLLGSYIQNDGILPPAPPALVSLATQLVPMGPVYKKNIQSKQSARIYRLRPWPQEGTIYTLGQWYYSVLDSSVLVTMKKFPL